MRRASGTLLVMRLVRRGTGIFWRVVALALFLLVLADTRELSRGHPHASVLLLVGFSVFFFAGAWVKPLCSHPAYATCVSATGWIVIYIDAWLRQSKIMSLYGFFAAIMVAAAIAAIWVESIPSDEDEPESQDATSQ
jgi:hypothetical protein